MLLLRISRIRSGRHSQYSDEINNVQQSIFNFQMTTIKGPGIFLAQFMGDAAPFNNLKTICEWAKSIGFVGVQIPTWDSRCIDLQKAAESKTYCDELKGIVSAAGLTITELSTHLQGQLIAVHPAYYSLFDGFDPEPVRNSPT